MNQNTRTILGAAVVFAVFVALAWLMPDIMRVAGDISPWAAAAVVAIFLVGFFAVFWLRARLKR